MSDYRTNDKIEDTLEYAETRGSEGFKILAAEIRRLRLEVARIEADLAGEAARHDFTLSKWFQERKELTDALVKIRDLK